MCESATGRPERASNQFQGTDPLIQARGIQMNVAREETIASAYDLSVSHLARFVATFHWTTSPLAWREFRDSLSGLSRRKYYE